MVCDYYDEKSTKESIIQMLRKAHDYEDGQYVLWLDFDLYSLYDIHTLDAKIEFADETGSVIQTVANTYKERGNKKCAMIRHPYPNKHIHQIGYKNGQKRIYGLPIVYDDFRNIERIKKIYVTWTAYSEIYLKDKPFMPFINQLIIQLDVNFLEPDETKRWYTIGYKHEFENQFHERLSKKELTDEEYKNAVKEYDMCWDFKVGYESNLELIDFENNPEFEDYGVLQWWGRAMDETVSDEMLSEACDALVDMKSFDEERVHMIVGSMSMNAKDECNYNKSLYKGRLEVEPKACATMLISSTFGFK